MIKFPPQFNIPTQIFNIPKFLDKSEILNLSQKLKKIPYEKGVIDVGEEGGVGILNSSIRKSKVKWIPQSSSFNWLYNKLINQIQQTNSTSYKFDILGAPEMIQYTEYSSQDKDHYNWHIDLGEEFTCFRKISISILLSSPKEFEGGDLEFMTFNENSKKIAPKNLGNITIFPSFIPHRVTPVIKGTRRSLVMWVGGKPFK